MTSPSFMVRLNFLLAIVLIVSGLYLVKISYESRRLFADIEQMGGDRQGLGAHLQRRCMGRGTGHHRLPAVERRGPQPAQPQAARLQRAALPLGLIPPKAERAARPAIL